MANKFLQSCTGHGRASKGGTRAVEGDGGVREGKGQRDEVDFFMCPAPELLIK